MLLFVAIGVNANEIHKWNHLPARKRPRFIAALHSLRLLQTPQHHIKHHVAGKDTHYCVITNVVNPVVDAVRFWRILEKAIAVLFGAHKRLA